MKKEKIAVLVPCYNEELTIKKVIDDFRKQLPEADIYVYDNNSKDDTAKIAKKAKAIVKHEYNQGKGNVVRSMFRDVDADIYVLVDGDDTYPADEVHKLIDAVREGTDMAIGDRLSSTYYTENKRAFHNFGNSLVKWLINIIFDNDIKDVMTGYRAFSKKFVKTIAVTSPGFEIETELTITALEYRYNIKQIPIQYRDRPEGSVSKLNTISDGIKVMITLFDMAKDYRPLLFFFMIAVIVLLISLLMLISSIRNSNMYMHIFSIALFVVSALLVSLGLILDHSANIDKKNHELIVNDWVNRNKN